MKIRYDNKADAIYIYLTESTKKSTETEEISNEIFMDYDASGQPIGIEIIGVKDKLPTKTLQYFQTRPNRSAV